MGEIRIDGFKVGILRLETQQRFAHRYQRRDAARCQVEAADKFLPARFGGDVQFQQCLWVLVGAIGIDCGFETCRLRAEARE